MWLGAFAMIVGVILAHFDDGSSGELSVVFACSHKANHMEDTS